MRTSLRTEYGLRVLVRLAVAQLTDELMQSRELAAENSLTVPYVDQLMIKLKQAGWVQSVRGRNGGYKLEPGADKATVLQVIEAFEGPVILGTGERRDPLDRFWCELTGLVRREAAAVTIAQLRDQIQQSLKQDES